MDIRRIAKGIGTLGVLVVLMLVASCVAYAEELDLLSEISEAAKEGTVYEISVDGTKDFATIQEGVDAAQDGDTLLIYPGVYEESVNANGKEVNLLGTSREMCILTFAGDDYAFPPLAIGAGSVKNMTIRNYKSERSHFQLIYPFRVNTDFAGYAIHIEDDYLYGRSLEIANCLIESENNFCVGMGGRGSAQIMFRDCEFQAEGSAGCVYLHDGVTEEVIGETEIAFINCVMDNENSPYFLAIHSVSEYNTTYLTFQNVAVNTPIYEDEQIYDEDNMYHVADEDVLRVPIYIWNYSGETGDGWCGLTHVYLTADSCGNTLDVMNTALIAE